MEHAKDFDYEEYFEWYYGLVDQAELEGSPLRHIKHIVGNLLASIDACKILRRAPDKRDIEAIIEYRRLISTNEDYRRAEFHSSNGFFADILDFGERTAADYVFDSRKRLEEGI